MCLGVGWFIHRHYDTHTTTMLPQTSLSANVLLLNTKPIHTAIRQGEKPCKGGHRGGLHVSYKTYVS